MMGIRMQAHPSGELSNLWELGKPAPVLTLEDLARVTTCLQRHPHNRSGMRVRRGHRSSARGRTSAQSLRSIPEDRYGEGVSEEGADAQSMSTLDSAISNTESCSKSSRSSKSPPANFSERGNWNSPPPSISEFESSSHKLRRQVETPSVKLRYAGRALFEF